MRAVDGQQLLRCRDHGFRIGLFAQNRFGQRSGTVAQSFALAGQPAVETGVHTVKVFEQFTIEQRQRGGLVG